MMRFYSCFCLIFFAAHLQAQDVSHSLERCLMRSGKNGSFNGTALVVYKGQILLHKGYGLKNANTHTLNDSSTIFRIGSLSKPFTATLILRLFQDHRLDLQDPISRYLPGYPNGDSIRIEHLLTHSSGIKDYLEVPALQSLPDDAPPISLDSLIGYFRNEPGGMHPGEKFAYSNSNYILLAAIIEKVTGKKFERYAREIIFEPLQMDHSGFDYIHLKAPEKATGYANLKKASSVVDFDSTYAPGCGSMYTSATDLYKWYKGLCTNRILDSATLEQAFLPRKRLYGYGWFAYRLYGRKCISHAGGVPGYLSNLQFYPKEDLCIVLLSNADGDDLVWRSDLLASVVFHKPYKSSGL